jgi:glutathione S-transferase
MTWSLTMYRLHDNMSSGNAYKVRLLLSQLGIPFERIEYNVDRAETRTPEFLGKNPNGRIPVLELSPGRGHTFHASRPAAARPGHAMAVLRAI